MPDIVLPAEHIETIREALGAYRDERWFNDPAASDTSLAQRSRDMERINAALAAITQAQRAPTVADGAWEPVPDGYMHKHQLSTGRVLSWVQIVGTIIRTSDTIHLTATELPDDVRLCRRATAPSAPVADSGEPPTP